MSIVALKRISQEKYFNKVSKGNFSLNGNVHKHSYQGNVNLIESKEKICCDNHNNTVKKTTLSTSSYHAKIFKCNPCKEVTQQKSQVICGSTNSQDTVTSSERTKKLKDTADCYKCSPNDATKKCIVDARKCS
jgi:hypothetical protein